MSPNLYVAIRRLVTPWELCTSSHTTTSSPKDADLYISYSPVPGLYVRTRKNERYLVALKNSPKPDTEHIFVINKTKEEASRREREQAKELKKRLDELDQGFAPSKNEVYIKEEISIQTDHTSATEGRRTSITTIEANRSRSPSQPRNKSKTSILSSSGPIRTPDQILGTTKTSRRASVCYKNLGLRINDPVNHQQIDMTKYQFLRSPLKIQYCTTLGRCLFTAELESRTVVVEMCASPTCMKKDPYACGATTKRTLFCLDDGISWVVVEKRKKGHFWKPRMKGGRVGVNENTMLYCLDKKTDVMRRQTVEEAVINRRMLRRMEGMDRLVLLEEGGEGEAEYMPVLRYLGNEWRKDEAEETATLSGETLRSSIEVGMGERKSLELVRVQCANW